MKRKTTFSIIATLSVSLAAVAGGYIAKCYKDSSAQPIERAEAAYNPGTTYNVSDTKEELDSYYSSISDTATGTSLLSQLRTLNSTKRKKTVGYGTMGTSTSGAFVYTDYDLKATATDSKGQKYGTKVASFYTKTSATSWNREHTWPNSHGGNLIEGDILMTRPTITAENSNRGNSFYVEGKNSQSNGWDPYAAGYAEWCRGECARIILYGVVANSSLNLIDSDYHSTSNSNRDNLMGNINTLIKWHFNYSPNQYEINRNNGGEYLQGNRNPFVDHPEYVAKIWSNFNSTVSTICSQKSGMYANWIPGSCSTYGTNDAVSGEVGETATVTSVTVNPSTAKLDLAGTKTQTLTATVNGTNSPAQTVTWSSSDSNIVSVSNGTITAKAVGTATITATSTVDTTKKGICSVTVVDGTVPPEPPAPLTLDKTEMHIAVKEQTFLIATVGNEDKITWTIDKAGEKVLHLYKKESVSGEKFYIYSLSNGVATLTATSSNGESVSCVVTIGTGKAKKANINTPLVVGLSAGGGTILIAGLIVLIILLVKKKHV